MPWKVWHLCLRPLKEFNQLPSWFGNRRNHRYYVWWQKQFGKMMFRHNCFWTFDSKVYVTVIPRNVRVAEAPSHGMSVIEYDSASRGAIAYLGLAGEVIRGNNQHGNKEKRTGRAWRLLGSKTNTKRGFVSYSNLITTTFSQNWKSSWFSGKISASYQDGCSKSWKELSIQVKGSSRHGSAGYR